MLCLGLGIRYAGDGLFVGVFHPDAPKRDGLTARSTGRAWSLRARRSRRPTDAHRTLAAERRPRARVRVSPRGSRSHFARPEVARWLHRRPGRDPAHRGAGLLGVLRSQKAEGFFQRAARAMGRQARTLARLRGYRARRRAGSGHGIGFMGMGGGRGGGRSAGEGGIAFGGWTSAARCCGGRDETGFGISGTASFGTGGRLAVRPRVFMSAGQVRGGLDAETIRRRIRSQLPRIRHCYSSRGLLGNPKLTGTVRVKFTINRIGRVGLIADAGSDLPHRGTVRCVLAVVHRIRFPRPRGTTPIVTYPFRFRPQGGR